MAQERRARSIAWFVGAAIAVLPLLGLNLLLWFHITAHGQEQIRRSGEDLIRVADGVLDDAMAAVVSLGMKGVRSCDPGSLGEIQSVAYTSRIRDLSVLDPQGEALCNGLGHPRVIRVRSPIHDTVHPRVKISVVDNGRDGGPKTVQIAWTYDDGVALSALVPGESMLPPQVASQIEADYVARLSTVDGTFIVSRVSAVEDLPASDKDVAFEAKVVSSRYPVGLKLLVSVRALWSRYGDLFFYGNVGGAGLGAVVMLVAIAAGRKMTASSRQIQDALADGEFIPYYQPVIDISTGRLVGCEVLMRWRKKDGTIVPPGHFIGLAEAGGHIFEMTRLIMEKTRVDLAPSYGLRPYLKVAFNLFAGHFDDFKIVKDVARVFGGGPIKMSQLVFEVTERQPLPNVARARIVIAKLQELGCRVSLDDVGTGHSGLSYLMKLGVDQMKIDKMFVDAIGTDRHSAAIVDTLVRLATELKIELVAEGVETFEQVQYLRERGVRVAQGYLFAPPLPAKSYLALLHAMDHGADSPPVDEEPALPAKGRAKGPAAA